VTTVTLRDLDKKEDERYSSIMAKSPKVFGSYWLRFSDVVFKKIFGDHPNLLIRCL
jgi:hypothetical protein